MVVRHGSFNFYMGCSDVELSINLCHHVAGILNLHLPRSDIYAEI